MISPPVIMALVAATCATGAAALTLRPAPTEAAVYRHRIAATMLAAGAIILAAYAYALHLWSIA